MTRAAGKATLVLAAVLIVGIVAGVVLEEVVDDWAWIERLEGEEDIEDAEEAILDDLDLSQDQERRVEDILDAREDRIESYWRERLPEVSAIVDSTRAEIRAVLTAEQRSTYDRRIQEIGERANGRD